VNNTYQTPATPSEEIIFSSASESHHLSGLANLPNSLTSHLVSFNPPVLGDFSTTQLPFVAQGEPLNPCEQEGFGGCLEGTNESNLGTGKEAANNVIIWAARLLIYIIVSVSILFIVIGALQMMSNDQEDVKSGKHKLTWALVGLVVAILSFSIVAIVTQLATTVQL
jgi:hypothetical protein